MEQSQQKAISKFEKLSKADFSTELEVTLSDGSKKKIREIKNKVQILCPFCNPADRQNPDKHNAFIDINKAGQYYLYCSSQDKTFWCNANEINIEHCILFYNEEVGFVARLEQESGSYKVFKNNDDWMNYCFQNNVNPNCKLFLPRRPIIFDPSQSGGLRESYFNMFRESKFLQKCKTSKEKLNDDRVILLMKEHTPVIHEIMMNVFGEEEYLLKFINWNAAILTRKRKSRYCVADNFEGTRHR